MKNHSIIKITLQSLLVPLAAAWLSCTASAQILTNESFSTGSGAGGNGGQLTTCMIMSDGTSWSGGAVGVQGTNCINDTGGYSTAANVTFKFGLGAAMSTLNSQYGAGNWTITNAQLSFQYTLYANNSRFNGGAGTFDIYWVANNDWYQGTTNPIYAASAAALATWSGGQALIGSEYYPWSTPWYTGTDSDLTKSGVWVTDKTGVRQSTNYYNLTLDPSFVGNITTATATTNAYLSLYLMATDQTIGLCIFTGGAAYLPTLTFQVIPTPLAIATQPLAQTVLAGSNVTFAVAATGAGPLAYQWYFNGNAISGATATNYSFTAADPTFDGGYSVVVTNAYGSITSSVAALTVNETSSLALSASANPAVCPGSVAFTANVTPSAATGTVQFLTNGVVFDVETLADGTATSVTLATLSAGTNLVEADYSGDSVYTPSTNTLTEVVDLAPGIALEPVSVTVTNGNDASFGVTATGTAPLAYQWYFNGNAITEATTAGYDIPAADPTYAGAYTVVITNAVGSVTSSVATLTVLVPPAITAQPASLTVTNGNSANFSVTATGTAPLGYQWYFGTNALSGATATNYSLAAVAATNAGNYSVVITNAAGSVTSSLASLTILLPPTITSNPINQVLANGATLNLSVAVSGTGPFGYQWFKDKGMVLGATSSTFTVANAGVTNSGVYYVVVTNAYGLGISLSAYAAVGNPELLAWGYNNYGQLGDGSKVNKNLPEVVATNAVTASAGYWHSLFLKSDGTLWGMGYNNYGELGLGNKTSQSLPVMVANNVASVAAGLQHSLFVDGNGTLWATGYNGDGQLGNGTTTTETLPVAVASNVVESAAGWQHSLFLKNDGTLWGMGDNANGQLGNGTYTSTKVPVFVASNVVAVAAGDLFSIFLKADGTLWSMGSDTYAQLGTSGISGDVPGLVDQNVVSLSAGWAHGVYLKGDGSMWAMGYDTWGQLDNDATSSRVSTPVSGANNVTVIAAGSYCTLFEKNDGSLWGVGYNSYGTLGNGAGGTAVLVPTQVQGITLANVVSGCEAEAAYAIGQAQLPTITSSPVAQSVLAGGNVTFSVAATGFLSLTYQWYYDGSLLTGATATSYAISGATLDQAGNYFVVVSNFVGSVTSSVVALDVLSPSSVALTSSANPVGYQGSIAFTASITPSDATGTVQFLTNSVVFDTETLASGTTTSVVLTSLPVGTNLIAACYSGDSVYGPSTNTLSQVVTNRVLNITGIAPTADGNFGFSFAGVPGDSYVLEGATNLAAPVWLPIFTNTADVNGLLQVEDGYATNYPARFYRIQQQ
jgi:alpha-tubulin suppressor-like RCC1 family protein